MLGVKNTGDEPLPELAFTIETDDGVADGSFNIRIDDPPLSNPNRPVWILENKYPRVDRRAAAEGRLRRPPRPDQHLRLRPARPGRGEDDRLEGRPPCEAGTYTLHYQVEAGLDGAAKAVTADGGEVKGEFVVTISDKAPKATVNDKGQVVTQGE